MGEVLRRLVAMFVLSLLYKVDSIRPQMNADLAARRAEKSENGSDLIRRGGFFSRPLLASDPHRGII